MPPGAPHHSFLLPYRIRVDEFTTPRDQHYEPPALYFLSHTHTDHINGLSARSFGAQVVCSVDAKHMLLNSETSRDRVAFDTGETSEKRRPHSHLKIDYKSPSSSKHGIFSRDLLRALPINSPTMIELSDDVIVTVTLLDANHCPGAVMFLVEGPLGNFLHTGDFRAETPFLESLTRNPWLQRYTLPSAIFVDSSNGSGEKPLRTLDAIHLDTACLLSHHDLLSKDEACSGLVELISLFPPPTRFFINSWTWGYEDILKAIGRAFNSKIHVDRYKFDIYSGISDPFLKSLLTLDSLSTRFHACERKNRCERVEYGTAGVVYVNPVTLSKVKWDKYFHETRASLLRGEHVSILICPLSRHSSLPELRAFVKLFKPKIVVPNSLNPDLGHLDWACMPVMFGDCLADGGEAAMRESMRDANINVDCLDYVAPKNDIDPIENGAEMDNLVGEGAEKLARQWIGEANDDGAYDATTKESWMTTQMGRFLGPRGKQLLEIQLNAIALRKQEADNCDSEGEDEAEARGKAADVFFAPTSPITLLSALTNHRTTNTSSNLLSHSTSLPLIGHPSTHSRRTIPQKMPGHSRKHFSPLVLSADSPFRSKVSQMSTASPSPPLFNSLHSSDERAYHSLFDALQFNKLSASSAPDLPVELSHDLSSRHTVAFALRSAKGMSDFPRPKSSPPMQKVLCLPIMPLVSPSVTPSPPQPPLRHSVIHNLKGGVPPTPVSHSKTTPLRDMSQPPMLDLKKMLKRSSSEAGLSRPVSKRRIRRSDPHTPVNPSSYVNSKHVPRCASLEGLDIRLGRGGSTDSPSAHVSPFARSLNPISADPAPVLLTPSRSTAEKERRSKAKAIQVGVRAKLVRALPSKDVTPTCLVKVERRMQALAELRARNKTSIIVRKQSIYGLHEVPSQRPDRNGTSEFRQAQMVIFDESTMDWDKNRQYQEGFKIQRKEGIRYPQLPRLEKSFAQSQSP